jgi:3-hydroxybutyryl-CoA dehydrogenase
MGPFELMDLTGIDVNLAAATGVWERLGRPGRLRPSPIQETLVATGRLGRKTGTGFYDYAGGRRGELADDFATRQEAGASRADVVARIEAAIAREAALAVEEGVATADAIGLALKLGAGHPRSPFDRADRPGP